MPRLRKAVAGTLCQQGLVANRFEKEAFQLLKEHGIVPATPGNLFGAEETEG